MKLSKINAFLNGMKVSFHKDIKLRKTYTYRRSFLHIHAA